jgi:hypothetical protein
MKSIPHPHPSTSIAGRAIAVVGREQGWFEAGDSDCTQPPSQRPPGYCGCRSLYVVGVLPRDRHHGVSVS